MAYCDILDGDYDSALSNIQKGLDTGDQDEKQALLFNEIVAYEKKMDYASAKEKSLHIWRLILQMREQ
ncbi:hypothetical protein LC724_31870 [Blautia sp. RD014234]|nr:hypothetical protein [Blautia parvula]